MTFQTTALIKLHGSQGLVTQGNSPSNEVLLKWVWRTPMLTCSRILILLSKANLTFFPFQPSVQRLKPVNVKHRGLSTMWWYKTSLLKKINHLAFQPNHVRVHPYFPDNFELQLVLTGATLFTSDVRGLENGLWLRRLCQGVLWSLKLVEYLSIPSN